MPDEAGHTERTKGARRPAAANAVTALVSVLVALALVEFAMA